MVQADVARTEALLRAGRAFLYETLDEAWQVVTATDLNEFYGAARAWGGRLASAPVGRGGAGAPCGEGARLCAPCGPWARAWRPV
jgi:hypothetical protein